MTPLPCGLPTPTQSFPSALPSFFLFLLGCGFVVWKQPLIVDRYLLAHVHNHHKHLAQVFSLRYGFGARCGRCCVALSLGLGLANMVPWISSGCREYVEMWHYFLVCFYLVIVKNCLIVGCVVSLCQVFISF